MSRLALCLAKPDLWISANQIERTGESKLCFFLAWKGGRFLIAVATLHIFEPMSFCRSEGPLAMNNCSGDDGCFQIVASPSAAFTVSWPINGFSRPPITLEGILKMHILEMGLQNEHSLEADCIVHLQGWIRVLELDLLGQSCKLSTSQNHLV